MTSTTKSIRIEGSGQTVDYIQHLTDPKTTKTMIRVRIHVDTYPSQAWGRVDRWTGDDWKAVASVRGDALKTDLHIGYQPTKPTVKDFLADVTTLLTLAGEVLRWDTVPVPTYPWT